MAESIDALAPPPRQPRHVVHHLDRVAAGAEGSQRREATLRQLDLLTRQVPVLVPEGAEICRHYAMQATALKRRGTPIGANDLWIACHALALNATLVSHTVSEFARIEGLRLEDWASS